MIAKPMMKETTELICRRGCEPGGMLVGDTSEAEEVDVEAKLVDVAVASISVSVETIKEVELEETSTPVSMSKLKGQEDQLRWTGVTCFV